MVDAHLFDGLANSLRNSQVFDADLNAVVKTFPDVGETAEGNWAIADSREMA